jgi:hypothetical protein
LGIHPYAAFCQSLGLADHENARRGGAKHPQPQEAPLLFPTPLIGMQQGTVAHFGYELLLEHWLQSTGDLVQALVDRRHTELQPEPVTRQAALPTAPARAPRAAYAGRLRRAAKGRVGKGACPWVLGVKQCLSFARGLLEDLAMMACPCHPPGRLFAGGSERSRL